MSASNFFKQAEIGQSIAIATNKQPNKTTNNHFFPPKINKVFLSQILQNVRFGQFFFENGTLARRAEKDAIKQKIRFFQEVAQKRKMVIKFTLQTALIFFKKGFSKICHLAKRFILSGSWSKTQNIDQNRTYPLSLSASLFPLKRVLTNTL